ncbi:MAG: D-glycero-beta-D-manno-heptose 1,7-bisphosphate 7-phosphatase [Gammaproteobacteria bacterium]|nr:D-glycero-beta-D-manno-heptose 1,7-bisphosphate 7-phosphatase [Gammaproteobacteria bacterium]
MKLVLLDRDGVINVNTEPFVASPADWMPIPGSLDAIATLNQAGMRVAVCTNQSAIARRELCPRALDAIHRRMNGALATHGGHIDLLLCCPHHRHSRCACRKPAPGMLLRAMARFRVAPEATCFVGDSESDMEAAWRAGCAGVLVRTGHGVQAEAALASTAIAPAAVFDDLAATTSWLLAR